GRANRLPVSAPLGRVPGMPGPPTLTDGTVTLRAHRGDDVDAVVEESQDPASVRWTTVPSPYTRADAQRFVHEVMPSGWEAGRWGFAGEGDGGDGGSRDWRARGGARG